MSDRGGDAVNLILRPMTPHAEILLSLLRENSHVTTVQARAAGVKGVVDAVAVLLDNGIKVRADWSQSAKCCRYRLVSPITEATITDCLRARSEVKNAASRGVGKAVWEIVQDGEWHTPEDVADAVGITPAKASSAFRRFGYSNRVRFKVEKRHTSGRNGFEYRITKAGA